MEIITRGFSKWIDAKACMDILDAIGVAYQYKIENGWYYISVL